MDTILDYVRWMGDLDFKQKPLCDLDIWVLCQIGYLDMKPVFFVNGGTPDVTNDRPGEDGSDEKAQSEEAELAVGATGKMVSKASPSQGLTVRTICRRIKDQGLRYNIRTVGPDAGQQELQDVIAASRRFGMVKVRDYVDEFDPDQALQFSAMTFEVGDRRIISYCGTDHTIAGWKEDFMISFTHTASQEKAVAYAEQEARKAARFGRKLVISGHSKGGNLALYAGCMMADRYWKAVESVYVLDGPGLCPEVADLSKVKRIDEKTVHFSPEYAIVSKLFPVDLKHKVIVKAEGEGLDQHALYRWGVDHGQPLTVEKHDAGSDTFESVFSRWMDGLSQEDREHFVDQFFDAISNNGQAITLDDIGADGGPKVEEILANMLKMDGESRKVTKELTEAVISDLLEKVTRTAEESVRTVQAEAKRVQEEVQSEAKKAGDKAKRVLKKAVAEAGNALKAVAKKPEEQKKQLI